MIEGVTLEDVTIILPAWKTAHKELIQVSDWYMINKTETGQNGRYSAESITEPWKLFYFNEVN